jgi:hypothetical protein
MTVLYFNSNLVWFHTPTGVVLGDHLRDGDLFTVRCLCNSWSVDDIYQQWGVDDFPEKAALRIAHFQMWVAPADHPAWKDNKAEDATYLVLLHPETGKGAPIPVLCDAVGKQFFGVATDRVASRRLAEAEGRHVWITVVIRIVSLEGWGWDSEWGELMVNRQESNNWARAPVRFAQT